MKVYLDTKPLERAAYPDREVQRKKSPFGRFQALTNPVGIFRSGRGFWDRDGQFISPHLGTLIGCRKCGASKQDSFNTWQILILYKSVEKGPREGSGTLFWGRVLRRVLKKGPAMGLTENNDYSWDRVLRRRF